jgi:hypothetical protein
VTPARAERVAGANRVARLWRLFAAVALLVLVAAPAVAGAAMRSWSSPIAVDTTGDQVQVAGVACSSVSQCTAIDGLGREATFDPGSPGAAVPVQIDSGQYLQAIACPSDRQCTAVDANGAELTFDPTAPGKPTPMPIDGGAVSIACPSASQCTAVEPDGREVTFDPTAPGTPTASPTGLGLAVGVACPSANQCTAVDLA